MLHQGYAQFTIFPQASAHTQTSEKQEENIVFQQWKNENKVYL